MATVPHIFGTQPAGNVPASYLDVDFADLFGQLIVDVTQFGVVGNGMTDDTVNFQTALDSLGAAGGTLRIPATCKCLVGNLTIPANVRVLGDLSAPDADTNNTAVNFEDLGSALYTLPATTITPGGPGVTFERVLLSPSTIKGAQQIVTTGFAGTCFTSTSGGYYGFSIIGCVIVGYAKAVITNNVSRFRFEWNAVHCLAGVDMTGSFDTSRILNNQLWPYLTIVNGGPFIQSGIGFDFKTGAADTWVDGNLVSGFLVGISVNNCASINFGNNWVDHPASLNRSGNMGVYFTSGVNGTLAGTFYIYGCKEGLVVDIGASAYLQIGSILTEQIDLNGIRWETGQLGIGFHGAKTVGGPAIKANTTAYQFQLGGFQYFSVTSNPPIDCGVASITPNIFRIGQGTWDGAVGSTLIGGSNALTLGTIVSSSTIALGNQGDAFAVSGTTGITTITGGWAGRDLTLTFLDVLTVTHDDSKIALEGGVNFTSFANSTLSLQSKGGNVWVETGRSKRDGTPVYANQANTFTGDQVITGSLFTTAVVGAQGLLKGLTGTAVASGAATQAFVVASSTNNLGVFYGTGNPSFSAAQGAIYTNTTASVATARLWVNTNGSTTWAFLTASA